LQKNKEVKVSNIILNEKDYHGDMTPCKGEYFKIYENNILGISFIYQGNIKSYIKEENGLRPFQRETLEAIKNSSAKLIFVEAPVGSGKDY